MNLPRATVLLLSTCTAAIVGLTACEQLECLPTEIEAVDAEVEAGYSADEFSTAVDGEYAIAERHAPTRAQHEGTASIVITDSEWQGWRAPDTTWPSGDVECQDPNLQLEAAFQVTIGDVDVSGTIAGFSTGPDSAEFDLYLDRADLEGGEDVRDRGYDPERVQLHLSLLEGELTLSVWHEGQIY